MINGDKFKGSKEQYDALARMINQINQRVRVLQRMGYEVSGVSQNAELYNDPEKYEKLVKKFEQLMNPQYIDEVHNATIRIMEQNLKQMFGEDIKINLTPAQLRNFITKYPEYASLMKLSPEKAKQELDKISDLLGGTKEGILNAFEDVSKPQPQTVPNKRPKFKKKRRK